MNRLLFDGGTGWQLPQETGLGSLPANLNSPDRVSRIARSFVDAGAQALTTNSLCAPLAFEEGWDLWYQAVQSSIDLARRACPQLVFLSLTSPKNGQNIKPFCHALKKLLSQVDGVLLETQTDMEKAVLMAQNLRDVGARYVVVSFAPPKEFAIPGSARPFAEQVAALLNHRVDALGLNCGYGDALLEGLKELWLTAAVPLLARPSAGMPVQGQYPSDGNAFAEGLCACARIGASLLGGCCGIDSTMLAQGFRALQKEDH